MNMLVSIEQKLVPAGLISSLGTQPPPVALSVESLATIPSKLLEVSSFNFAIAGPSSSACALSMSTGGPRSHLTVDTRPPKLVTKASCPDPRQLLGRRSEAASGSCTAWSVPGFFRCLIAAISSHIGRRFPPSAASATSTARAATFCFLSSLVAHLTIGPRDVQGRLHWRCASRAENVSDLGSQGFERHSSVSAKREKRNS